MAAPFAARLTGHAASVVTRELLRHAPASRAALQRPHQALLARGRDRVLRHAVAAQPWKIELMDYPHARVRLHFCKVFAWEGAFEMREGQQMAWQSLPVESAPVLPGTIPVLQWLAAERGHAGPTHLG